MIQYVKAIGVVALIIIIFIFSITALPWIIILIGLASLPNPPKPTITYAEFPFRLEYKIGDEMVIVEDTLICKYDGIGLSEGSGKYRKWKKYISGSAEDDILLLTIDESYKIYCTTGDASYYMGDNVHDIDYPFKPYAYYVEIEGKSTRLGDISSDDLLENYNIEIINWEYPRPVENVFVNKNK
jgi:hypothetical protein